MSRSVVKYLTPWRLNREREAARLAALRQRDGENCARCRRPMRFDLPPGHDLGARIEAIVPGSAGGAEALDNLCLTHGRCNAQSVDNTDEVTERVRRKAEAELFARSRQRRRA